MRKAGRRRCILEQLLWGRLSGQPLAFHLRGTAGIDLAQRR